MLRDDVVNLFKLIKNSYDNFIVSSEKADWWHEMLEDVTYEEAVKKLKDYIKGKDDRYDYIPKLSDFVKPYNSYELLKFKNKQTVEEVDKYWELYDQEWNTKHPDMPKMKNGKLVWDEWDKKNNKK